jgi:fatty-acyl-CoA synthase
MQSYRLTVDKFLDHAAAWSGARGIVEALPGGGRVRASYAEIRERANHMSGALAALGLEPGQRIGTLAWNSKHHFEIYYATMGMGLVCHTLNPRLTAGQLTAMINEAEDALLAVAADLVPLALDLARACPSVRHIVVLDEAATVDPAPAAVTVWDYAELLAAKGAPHGWGDFPEEAPAGLCYTSGTTGEPRGVLYTHRSNYLHTIRSLQADAFAITARDTVLLAVPMFHANGWGLPFSGPASGARLVLPGRKLDGESLVSLMREEGVTVAVGVPTVWFGMMDRLEQDGGELPALERILVGGSTCPEALIRRVEDRLGAQVQTSWGMTELSPMGTIAPPGARGAAHSGRPPLGIAIRLADSEGVALPEQRGKVGHLLVQGASVIDRYFNAEEDALDADGFFDTGDLAMLDADGNLVICGRSKDLIKSGGEWINPAEIEALAGADPSICAAAVIPISDEKWGERPLLVVQARHGRRFEPASLLETLRGQVPDWWIPTEVAEVSDMPLAATGKIDKNRLREQFESGALEARRVAI